MFQRVLDIESKVNRKSLFLLGPRQTGKTTYLKSKFPNAYFFDLLKPSLFREILKNPQSFTEIVEAKRKETHLFVVDEIQKAPILLDEIHRLMELDKKLRFILTGSSARKLKRQGVNLLGGRATRVSFHPLCFPEYQESKISLSGLLNFGKLPSIVTSTNPEEDLKDYVGLYLKEEIQAEGISRSIQNFSDFIQAAGLSQCEQINFTAIGSDAQIPPRTVIDYFRVLEDTLVGYLLPAFTKTKKRKAMTSAKFYLFDVGVGNLLASRQNAVSTSGEFSKILEHFIFTEIRAFLDYSFSDRQLYYWRSTSQFEVDFLIPETPKSLLAIEVKSGKNPTTKDYKGLFALEEEFQLRRKIVVCQSTEKRKTSEGVELYPIQSFLSELWNGKIIQV